MGKQKSVEYQNLAAQIRPLLPASIDEIVVELNADKKAVAYVMRNIIGNEHLSPEKPEVTGPLWGQSKNDKFFEF